LFDVSGHEVLGSPVVPDQGQNTFENRPDVRLGILQGSTSIFWFNKSEPDPRAYIFSLSVPLHVGEDVLVGGGQQEGVLVQCDDSPDVEILKHNGNVRSCRKKDPTDPPRGDLPWTYSTGHSGSGRGSAPPPVSAPYPVEETARQSVLIFKKPTTFVFVHFSRPDCGKRT